jgi:glutathione S-transferase
MTIIVYGPTFTPFVKKVHLALAEKGLAFEAAEGSPAHPSEEFAAASPFKKIPAIKDGDFTLGDSSAICHYLDAQYPAHPLIPSDPNARGLCIFMDEVVDTILFPALAKILGNRVVKPLLRGLPCDEAVVQEGIEELNTPYAYFESVLQSDFLLGDSLTLADIALGGAVLTLEVIKVPVDAALYPKLAAFAARMKARPAFAKLYAEDIAFMG